MVRYKAWLSNANKTMPRHIVKRNKYLNNKKNKESKSNKTASSPNSQAQPSTINLKDHYQILK